MAGSAVSQPAAAGPQSQLRRRLPIGAEPIGDGRTHVRVWAPRASSLNVVVGGKWRLPLEREDSGYFSGAIAAGAGDRYQFQLDDDEHLYPDPASRFQPDGPHGASEIIDPATFRWNDDGWRGVDLDAAVFYELHVGTFTRAGTWAAAANELQELARLGITVVEVMPVAEFDGRFGWGYDGVDLFAPAHLYGRPDDFRRFVDAAHSAGVAVVLDVVPNHFGPSGNYLRAFSPSYFSDKYGNEWGEAINFDGPDSGPVREFFIANAGYWIDEFHLDGLRLDATQQVFDTSADHILAAMTRRAREAACRRTILLVAENETQHTTLVRSAGDGGYGLDALWNDDFHHSVMVAVTGRAEAYYSDTRGDAQELLSAVKYGYLYQGQHYHWQGQPRGTPAWGVRPEQFIAFVQNHDQVANSAGGDRGHQLTSRGRWRAVTALLLLAPSTPMMFQGEEFSASAPFLYFADFADGDLAAAVKVGRRKFLSQFPSLVDITRRGALDDPCSAETFERCRLDFRERETHRAAYALHADLLALRRSLQPFRRTGLDGAVLSPTTLAIRFFSDSHAADRLLIVNLGPDLRRHSIAEPLLAPPAGTDWAVAWCTEDPKYDGRGVGKVVDDQGHWLVPAECAVFLEPGPLRPSVGHAQLQPK